MKLTDLIEERKLKQQEIYENNLVTLEMRNEFLAQAMTLTYEAGQAHARDQEAKLWFETWYSHYLAPEKPMHGEFSRFATERIQMTGYLRDQTPTTDDLSDSK